MVYKSPCSYALVQELHLARCLVQLNVLQNKSVHFDGPSMESALNLHLVCVYCTNQQQIDANSVLGSVVLTERTNKSKRKKEKKYVLQIKAHGFFITW